MRKRSSLLLIVVGALAIGPSILVGQAGEAWSYREAIGPKISKSERAHLLAIQQQLRKALCSPEIGLLHAACAEDLTFKSFESYAIDPGEQRVIMSSDIWFAGLNLPPQYTGHFNERTLSMLDLGWHSRATRLILQRLRQECLKTYFSWLVVDPQGFPAKPGGRYFAFVGKTWSQGGWSAVIKVSSDSFQIVQLAILSGSETLRRAQTSIIGRNPWPRDE